MLSKDHRFHHVVILGAGATCAAFPDGDCYGKPIPAMNGFLKKTKLEYLLKNIDLKSDSDNLEDIYSQLYQDTSLCNERLELEKAIIEYLQNLDEGNDVNLYHHLLACLSKDDFIFSFNWDPFLVRAYKKLSYLTNDLPKVHFLHGNVIIGQCKECKQMGYLDTNCVKCGKPLSKSKILFPTRIKDYSSDDYIKGEWEALNYCLEDNGMNYLTIFGYSAPSSDIDIVRKKEALIKSNQMFNFLQIEVINNAPFYQIKEKLKKVIMNNHFSINTSFYDSWLAKNPKRSCENFYSSVMLCEPVQSVNKFGSCAIDKTTTWGQILGLYEGFEVAREEALQLYKGVLK